MPARARNVFEQFVMGVMSGEDALPPISSDFFPASDFETGEWIGSIMGGATTYLCEEHQADFQSEMADMRQQLR